MNDVAARDLGLSFEPALLNAEYEAWKAAHGESLAHCRNVGRMLCEAKDRLLHGQWKVWLAQNYAGSERTAQVAIQVHGAWEHHPELLADTDGQLPSSIQGTLSAVKRTRRERNQPAIEALNAAAEADESVRRRKLIAAFERMAAQTAETLKALPELVALIESEAPKRAELAGIAGECARAWQATEQVLRAGEQQVMA